jgi:hypothetical protein
MVVHEEQDLRGQPWWYMPVIPATQEVEVGGSQSKCGSGKSMKHYLKHKLTAKGLEHGSSDRAPPAMFKALGLIPVPKNREKRKERI